ncbi:hypothetical protein K3495_g6272 [Podosphaera aphanis]|nr:hypothetical protein K3495_g6272 [Podosphaera aphanis]
MEPYFTPTGYSDADSGKGYDRKSISGSVIILSGGAVKWWSEKQRLITVSTRESEYIAANLTGKNRMFLRDLMEELEMQHSGPVPLFMDSDGAIALTKYPENMRATIYIEGRMVQWYTSLAVLPSRLWAAWTHAPLETGESWFESSKTR